MTLKAVQKATALLALLLALLLQLHTLVMKPLEGDFVCYGLAAANLVAGGPFATPQLGSQYEMDTLWHFNSPLLGLGAAPFFWAGGIAHNWYMLGCLLQLLLCFSIFLCLNLKVTHRQNWPAAVALTVAWLTTRIYMGEFLNQRYSTISFAAIALLFFPFQRFNEKSPMLQWAVAGLLPLIHPALLPASVLWVAGEVAIALACRNWTFSTRSAIAFATGVLCSALWYLDLHGLKTQFLPHISSRTFVPFSGWNMFLSRAFALPSQMTFLMIILMILLAAASNATDIRDRISNARLVLVCLLVLLLDARGRMPYLAYYLVGMAPAAFASLQKPRLQNRFSIAFAVLASLQVAVELRLYQPKTYWPLSRSAAYEFLVAHSRPGDKIVVGPPFILSAASDASLPDGRKITMVVPMPMYLKDFDVTFYLSQIRSAANVYIGKPEYFDGVQRYYKFQSPPIFKPSQSETIHFQGDPILIARPAP